MDFICELCNAVLLFYIELALVHSVCNNRISELSAGQLVKNETLLTGIDYLAVVESLKLLCKLCLLGQLLHCSQNLFINLLCRIIVNKSLCHRNTVLLHTLCAILTGHRLNQIHALCLCEILKGSKGIQVFPCNHNILLLLLFVFATTLLF